MITRKDVRRVESGSHEKVIRDFRSRMSVKKEQAVMQSRAAGVLGLLCGVLSVAVLAGGVALINNYSKMQRMESVLASVLPAGVVNWTDYEKQKAEEPDFIIEELPGKVYPTEKETGETYTAETMESSVEEAVPSETISESSPGEETETQKRVGMGKESGQGDAAETVQPSIDYEAAAANGYRIYEIGEGETLYGICWKMYGSLSHLREICSLNGLEDENRILAGQKLILP